ncbi:MAG: hypothetical protein JXA68_00880 [Ignavibacteriales bacterium]|nr:hypothetical protein [Ignavibacteriales bacterium]
MKIVIIVFVSLFANYFVLFAQQEHLFLTVISDSTNENHLKNYEIKTEGQWFLGFQQINLLSTNKNQFTLKRGYITFKKDFTENLSVRFTQDITLDEEGSDAGNIEMRLKYCYLKYNTNQLLFFNSTYFEFGLVHRPWLSFEEDINKYRVQGTMYLERYDILNSADFGLTFVGLLGAKIQDDEFVKNSKTPPGKFGSFAIGIYNGGGYHAIENTNNKTIEGRVTVRPLHYDLPGLQLSYTFGYGKGNIETLPDFNFNSGILSYESESFVFSYQLYDGKGNSSGSMSDTNGVAYENNGYSIFNELKLLNSNISFFGRYDNFKSQNTESLRIIFGAAYYFTNKSKFIVDIDYFALNKLSNLKTRIIEAAIEIVF